MALLSVEELLKYPFKTRKRTVQQQIIAGGKPKLGDPHFPPWKVSVASLMEKVQWLTFSEKRKTFICWTCLLFCRFAAELEVKEAMKDLQKVLKYADKHERRPLHLEATMEMQIFIAENFRARMKIPDRTQYNLVVKRNHGVLKRVIDAVCGAVLQDTAFRSRRYSFNLLEAEDCLKILHLLRNLDRVNADLVDDAIALLKTPKMMNDMVDVITKVLKLAIKNEASKSSFVSVILSEHGSQKGKSQISVVLRYVSDGKVCERFVGFTNQYDGVNVGDNDDLAFAVLKLIQTTLVQYGITDKFLALSLDGAIIPWYLSKQVIPKTKASFYPYLVPWHSHGFGKIMYQSLSVLDVCAVFLKKLNAMENFLQNPKLIEKFETEFFPSAAGEDGRKIYQTSPFVTVVYSYRLYFIQFFENIIENCNAWGEKDIAQAVCLRAFLEQLHTIFMLCIFNKLFSTVFDENLNFVPHKGSSSIFDNPNINVFEKSVWDLRNNYLNLSELTAEIDPEGKDPKFRAQLNDYSHYRFNSLRQKISRHLLHEVEARSKSLSKLKFYDLLSCHKKELFPCIREQFCSLIAHLPIFFNKEDLKEELHAMTHSDFFDKKSAFEMMDYLAELNLIHAFPQLSKLLEFFLTLPCLPASLEKGRSKLEDINRCSYIPGSSGIPSGETSVLRVEREMLRNLRDSPNFYEYVIEMYHQTNKSMQLVQS